MTTAIRYGSARRYRMPVLIPAAMPGSPLLRLFSRVDRHMAHCANVCSVAVVKKSKLSNNFFMRNKD